MADSRKATLLATNVVEKLLFRLDAWSIYLWFSAQHRLIFWSALFSEPPSLLALNTSKKLMQSRCIGRNRCPISWIRNGFGTIREALGYLERPY